jgi:hypothetical protein
MLTERFAFIRAVIRIKQSVAAAHRNSVAAGGSNPASCSEYRALSPPADSENCPIARSLNVASTWIARPLRRIHCISSELPPTGDTHATQPCVDALRDRNRGMH